MPPTAKLIVEGIRALHWKDDAAFYPPHFGDVPPGED